MLYGYQMATKGTFSKEKAPFFHAFGRFSNFFALCKGRCTSLKGAFRSDFLIFDQFSRDFRLKK